MKIARPVLNDDVQAAHLQAIQFVIFFLLEFLQQPRAQSQKRV